MKTGKPRMDTDETRIRKSHIRGNPCSSVAKNPVPLRITDHALMRYCERVGNVDMDALKLAILAAVIPTYATLGNGAYPLPGTDCMAVVHDRTVVTIRPRK